MGLFHNLTGWHAIIILAAILLLFGATRLPALARSVGQSMNIFKSELRDATASPSGASTVPAADAVTDPQRPAAPAPAPTATVAAQVAASPAEPLAAAPTAPFGAASVAHDRG